MAETSPAAAHPVRPQSPLDAVVSRAIEAHDQSELAGDEPLLLIDVVDQLGDDDEPSRVTMVLEADELEVDESWDDGLELADESAAIADNDDSFPQIAAAIAAEVAHVSAILIEEPALEPVREEPSVALASELEGESVVVAKPEPDSAVTQLPVAEPEPVLQSEIVRGSEPEELQIARRVAIIDIERGHLFDDSNSLYGHDTVREMLRLTHIAEDEGAYDHEAPRIARLAFAVKHGLEAVLPQYARGYGKLAAVIRGSAEDGEISDDDRARITQIAAIETAKVTGPVHNAPDVHIWQETFDDLTLSALALDQAYYEAARVKDMNRAAKAVGIAIREGEHDYSGARQISMAAAKSAEALRTSDAEHQANDITQLMTSLVDADRVRGLLALRVLLEGHSYAPAKADLAYHIVSKLTDERLSKLDPATAARLMLALQRSSRFQAITPLGRSVSLMPERSEFDGTSALPSPQDARFWNADLHEGPLSCHAEAVTRLRQHGPKQLTYFEKNSMFEVRYTPRLH